MLKLLFASYFPVGFALYFLTSLGLSEAFGSINIPYVVAIVGCVLRLSWMLHTGRLIRDPKTGKLIKPGSTPSTPEAADEPVKRKRGRPRKTPLNEDAPAALPRSPKPPVSKLPVWVAALPRDEIAIDYRDTKDIMTRRTLSMIRLEWRSRTCPDKAMPPRALFGWCHEREGLRRFLLSRVIVAYDPDTGEIIDDLAAHLWDLRNENPRLESKDSEI